MERKKGRKEGKMDWQNDTKRRQNMIQDAKIKSTKKETEDEKIGLVPRAESRAPTCEKREAECQGSGSPK